MQTWGVSLLDTSVPEQMKYDFLAEAASHLMQVLKCRSKGLGAFTNKRFATQNKQMYIRLHCLLVQCHR